VLINLNVRIICAFEVCKLTYLRRAITELARLFKGSVTPEILGNMAVMYHTLKTENEMIVLYNIKMGHTELICDDRRWGIEVGLALNHMQWQTAM
jgi:hypothetical protein